GHLPARPAPRVEHLIAKSREATKHSRDTVRQMKLAAALQQKGNGCGGNGVRSAHELFRTLASRSQLRPRCVESSLVALRWAFGTPRRSARINNQPIAPRPELRCRAHVVHLYSGGGSTH